MIEVEAQRAVRPVTVQQLIERAMVLDPDAAAISAPGRQHLSYADLQLVLKAAQLELARFGVKRGDRVATLLRSGPETAVLSLAVMTSCTLAPLNPDNKPDEVRRYLSAVRATALILPTDADVLSLDVARELGLKLIRMRPLLNGPAGVFALESDELETEPCAEVANPDDIALVLHTSGTTAGPKVVPLTQRNISASARNIADSLSIKPGDRCLNVMPLFHVHGLIGGLLSSISAGAGVICPPGFIATEFFDWMDECAPTWYTAVPTMHQSILGRASRFADVITRRPLRFVRSCSSALPARVASELANTFQSPVLEAYGMTEAAHQLALTPLAGGPSPVGSVGKASGPELAIMGEHGELLGNDCVGEIVARGETIMSGYERNPSANDAAFSNGWFRTGDQGYIDGDSYLFITGRIKELINRAGEKVSPREVDEVLLQHPSVTQACAFAVPHPALGEDVAAAIVVREGAAIDPGELRAFADSRLAPFKVPRHIRIIEDIPKGPTGKVQRSQLAGILGMGVSQPHIPTHAGQRPPMNRSEHAMLVLWQEVLRLEGTPIEREDSFFDLGGDSVLAVQLITLLHDRFGVEVSLLDLLEHQTLESLSSHIQTNLAAIPRGTRTAVASRAVSPCVVPIQAEGDCRPLFAVHGVFGDVACFAELARELGPRQPVYGLQAPGLDGLEPPLERVEEMATRYIAELRAVQPYGPYQLLGYSAGGSIAYEMARQFSVLGEEVGFLGVIDHSPCASGYERVSLTVPHAIRASLNVWRNLPFWVARAHQFGARRAVSAAAANLKSITRRLRTIRTVDEQAAWRELRARASLVLTDSSGEPPDIRMQLIEKLHRAVRTYVPQPHKGSLTLFRAMRQPLLCSHDADRGWTKYVLGDISVVTVAGSHNAILQRPYVTSLARALRRSLAAAQQDRSASAA